MVSIGRDTLYVLKDGPERTLLGLDVATGKEKFSIPLQGFNFVPTNESDHGRDKKQRGRIYLVSASGVIQAIGEKP